MNSVNPESLRAAAARLRANARYADGQQHLLDLDRARELDAQARRLEEKHRFTPPSEKTQAAAERRKDLQRIHIAKRDLALSDETYRQLVKRITGCDSAGDLDGGQRRKLLAELHRLGWRPARAYRVRPSDRAATQADKIRALWIELGKATDLRDPTERGLGRFCRRVTGKQRPEWLRPSDANSVIEALKSWLARATDKEETMT